jgi:hypothetical protein
MVKKLTPDPPLSNTDPADLESSLVRASELLRCASATAYENGDNLTGSHRDLAFSVMHLIEMARAMVDRSLVCVEARS